MSAAAIAEDDDLAALLEESLADKREGDALKAARDRQRKGGSSSKQIAEDLLLVRSWEAKHAWQAEAVVAVFERHECGNCRAHQTIFRQFMLMERHRRLAATVHYIQLEEERPELPQRVAVQKWTTPMCVRCHGEFDFQFTNLIEWEGD